MATVVVVDHFVALTLSLTPVCKPRHMTLTLSLTLLRTQLHPLPSSLPLAPASSRQCRHIGPMKVAESDEGLDKQYLLYNITKAAVLHGTQLEAADPELTSRRITVAAICPGWCRVRGSFSRVRTPCCALPRPGPVRPWPPGSWCSVQ